MYGMRCSTMSRRNVSSPAWRALASGRGPFAPTGARPAPPRRCGLARLAEVAGGHDDDHRNRLAGGDEVVHDRADPTLRARPVRLVAAAAVEKVEHGIAPRGVVAGRQIHGGRTVKAGGLRGVRDLLDPAGRHAISHLVEARRGLLLAEVRLPDHLDRVDLWALPVGLEADVQLAVHDVDIELADERPVATAGLCKWGRSPAAARPRR